MINRIPLLGAIVVVLLLLVTCSTPPEIKKALLDTQQIISQSPDSAYTILKSIDRSELRGSKDQAHFALLWTQAQDKCYEPFTSDSLINIAVDYFKNSQDKDSYARALFYRGRYEISIDSVQRAIKTLKQAELISQNPNDLALINFDIGRLYEDQHIFDTSIERYKSAARFFEQAQHTSNLSITYTNIGSVYRIVENKDSSLYYLNKGYSIALDNRDTTEIISSSLGLINTKAIFSGDYNTALQEFHQTFSKYNSGIVPQNFYGTLLLLYYKGNKLDSARMVANDALATNTMSRVGMVAYLSEIEAAAGNYKKAIEYNVVYNELVDSLWESRLENYISKFEKKYDNARLINLNDNLRYSQTIWILISITLLFVALAIYFVYRNRMLRRAKEISSIRLFINDLQRKIEQYSNYSGIINKSTGTILKLINLSYQFQGNKELFYKKFTEIMSVKDNQKEVIKLITDSISTQRPELFESIAAKYPTLIEDEVIFMGLVLFGVTNEELSMLYQIEYHSVVVKWSRLRKKLNISNDKERLLSDLNPNN